MSMGVSVLRLTTHRYRLLSRVFAVYILLLLGSSLFGSGLSGAALVIVLNGAFPFVLIWTMIAFVNPDADLIAPGSHYPSYLLRLPVKTRTLAVWPMLSGAVASAGLWAVFAGVFLSSIYQRTFPILWPSALIASMVFCLQGLMWRPFRNGTLRLVLILGIPLPLLVTAMILSTNGFGQLPLALCLGLIGGVAAMYAWSSVSLARTASSGLGRSGRQELALPKRRQEPKALPVARPRTLRKPFQTPFDAQIWMEWRVQGRLVPILTTVVMVLATPPIFFSGGLLAPAALVPGLMLSPYILAVWPALPLVPVVMATVVGMGARRSNMRNSEGAYHLFYATRPLSSNDIVRAKAWAFSLGSAVAWGITGVTMLSWLLMPAQIMSPDGRLVDGMGLSLALSNLPISMAITMCMVVTLCMWLTWRNQLVGAFVDYMTSRWTIIAYSAWVLTVSSIFFSWMSVDSPTPWQRVDYFTLIPTLAFLLLLKLMVSAYFTAGIVSMRPGELGSLAKQWGRWAIGSSLLGVFLWELFNRISDATSAWYASMAAMSLLAAFLFPLARPLLARYALEKGRHRK